MGIVRKNFLIVTVMMVGTFLSILGLLYYGMPIYYNQAKQQELRRNYLEIVKEIDGKSLDQMIDLVREYDTNVPNLLLSLGDENSNIIYPDLTDEEVVIRDKEYLAKGHYDQLGAFTDTVKTNDNRLIAIQGEYAFHSLSDISQTMIIFYPFVLVIIFFLVSIVALIYSRLSNRRITSISMMTRKMQSLEKGLECKVKGDDEVAHLATDINALYHNLLINMDELKKENERTLARQKQEAEFVRMTSHELKTPIASMMGLVEGMLYNIGDFKNHDKYLQQCKAILEEQSQLVQSVLDATTVDLGVQSGQADFDLAVLLEQQMVIYSGLAETKKLIFLKDIESVCIHGNQALLMKTIKNVIDNAFRYTPEGKLIRLTLKDNQLVIENQAEKILTQEELEQVFQPFYRPDFSRAKKDGGTGIGLYMVKQVLDKHGFTYRFESVANQLMRFTIDFNNAKNRAE